MPDYQIATLNLQNFVEPPYAWYDWEAIYSAKQWQMKTAWLRQLWQQAGLDLLALQEVFSVSALQTLCHDAGLPHLLVAAEPSLQENHVFTAPVVALASRYPLQALPLPPLDPHWLRQLSLSEFQDSRVPLLARVELPSLGAVDLCVVHLKSRRPDKSIEGPLALVKSQLQRLSEAALLMQRLAVHYAKAQRPLLLLGDLNDELSAIMPLTQLVDGLKLQDAAELAMAELRPPTHYYGAQGKVLDYLLCSSEFDARFHHSVAEVSHYRVWDQHLVRPRFDLDGHSSDHAMVQMTLRPRR